MMTCVRFGYREEDEEVSSDAGDSGQHALDLQAGTAPSSAPIQPVFVDSYNTHGINISACSGLCV